MIEHVQRLIITSIAERVGTQGAANESMGTVRTALALSTIQRQKMIVRRLIP